MQYPSSFASQKLFQTLCLRYPNFTNITNGMKKKEEQTSKEVFSYDIWREKEAERIDPLLEKLDFEDMYALRGLLIDAFYAGEREGIDKAYEHIRGKDAK